MSATTPCPTCPWRKTSTVGGFDIPGFDLAKMQGLRSTVGEGDAFRTVMACHYSACGAEEPCVGYLYVEGWSNLNVRMMALREEVDMGAIDEHCEGLDLWVSFEEMLEAYEDAVFDRSKDSR